ncbi:hypothetical protein GCM10017771_23230 [Streptomyces capitiformicae]|uniref:Uncharacterized protein n=1 Tax=Streptomyces capitiformicae TaxID=2014920 RepID=A0A919L8B5_9ACTN|nr:hypothetical protein GCM10017771_23230 [Streptomyces capitiformicae]
MHLVSRLLEHGRALLLLLFGSAHRGRGAAPAPDSPVPSVGVPSPAALRACLARARHRRAPHLWPPQESPVVEADVIVAVLVRAYVPPENDRTRRLASPAGRAW